MRTLLLTTTTGLWAPRALDILRVLPVYFGRMPPPTQPSGNELGALLARVFAGDSEAARDMIERILLPILDAAVSHTLRGPGSERFEKDDVIQEVFLHLYRDDWRRLRSYDPEKGSLTTYLWEVTRRWVRDHIIRVPSRLQLIDDIDKRTSPFPDPEADTLVGELIDRLQEELDPEELTLFYWIYFEGASHAVAAMRLDIKLEALHKRVQRLEAKIRALVPEDFPSRPEKGRKP